ncbi:hypothetical protein PO124_34335 [Bacillus licheniformis]|nr:hypothetical protein [Bacillus licheniformis]
MGNRLSAHFRSSSNPLVIFGGNRQVCFQMEAMLAMIGLLVLYMS